MRRTLSAFFAASVLALGVVALLPSVASRGEAPAAPMCVASAQEPMLGCGETRCTRDADCPSTCGGCITWSGTCALFRPR